MPDKRVLYVDDEEMNLFLFSELLSDLVKVYTAKSGEEALKILNDENGNFDFIFSDLRMPRMDGYEFLEKVKERFPVIPRFLLTAHFEDEYINSAIDSGLFLKYFRKPLEPEVFLDIMK